MLFRNLLVFCFLFFIPLNAYAQTELSLPQRQEIYRIKKAHEDYTLGAVALNIIPFAPGSVLQGDSVTAASVITMDLVGSVSLLATLVSGYSTSIKWLVLGFGIGAFLIGRILSVFMPWISVPLHNAELRKRLNLSKNDVLSMNTEDSQSFSLTLYHGSF